MMRIRPSLVVVACALLLLLIRLPSQGKNSPGLSYDAAVRALWRILSKAHSYCGAVKPPQALKRT